MVAAGRRHYNEHEATVGRRRLAVDAVQLRQMQQLATVERPQVTVSSSLTELRQPRSTHIGVRRLRADLLTLLGTLPLSRPLRRRPTGAAAEDAMDEDEALAAEHGVR